MSDQPPNGFTQSGFQLAAGVPARYEASVAPLMAPFVEALISAAVHSGDSVLDVACGTGFAARAAARAVGEQGRVAAIDINAGMLAVARSQPVASGPMIDWRQGSALELPYDEGSFDAVIAQQGLQFFPDPAKGLREMQRVLRRGGVLAATVWAPVERSPYLSAQRSLLMDSVALSPAIFEQACPSGGELTLRAWALAAELADVEVRAVERVVLFPPLDEYIASHLHALPWSTPFFELDQSTQSAAIARMVDALSAFVNPDGTASLPTTSLLLTATRPA